MQRAGTKPYGRMADGRRVRLAGGGQAADSGGAMTASLPAYAAVIDGHAVRTEDTIEVLDPGTGRPCALVPSCAAAEIDLAVASARRTFETVWRHATAGERAGACRRMAEVLRAHRGELADLETLDTGKPCSQARTDVDVAARYFDYYAGTIEALFGDTLLSQPDLVAYTLVEPHGVCAHITPWNYPLQV